MEFCQIEQGNNFEKKQIKQKHEKRKMSKTALTAFYENAIFSRKVKNNISENVRFL